MEANSIIQTWDDLVFEHRNKLYGAYPLRRAYAGRLLTGSLTTVIIMLVILSLHNPSANTQVATVRPVVFDDGIILTSPPSLKPKEKSKPIVDKPKKTKAQSTAIRVTTDEVIEQEEVTAIEEYVSGSEEDFGTGALTEGIGTIAIPAPVVESNEPVNVAEVMPYYEGGMEAMMKFIQKKIRYPRAPRSMGIEGTVFVAFVVNGDGSVSDVKIIRGFHRDCDDEALRVVSMLPAWKGGRHNGRPVRVRMVLPIKFNLHE